MILEAARIVISDAAMHHACLIMALRWCPHLHAGVDDFECLEVDSTDIYADGVRLDTISDYGEETKSWTVRHP
ncbi:hypothetical protein AB0I28_32260 [Phytomonospora sp. NPDC050363]|uniref:hypothetical protein n=1 Tax=Phytomonospora sp. NPDC050363 TaxID=3155642 RepID=UPI00340267AB